MKVEFLRLDRDYAEVRSEVARRFEAVLASQRFVLGPQTEELERRLGTLLGARVVGCGSGTRALVLALEALGVGPGACVVVPALSFFATAGAVCRAGARPVFADVDEATLTLGPEQLAETLDREFVRRGERYVHRASGAWLAAVIPVHLYGYPVDVGQLQRVTGQSIPVVEDAAQAIGARAGGTAAGTAGALGCLSFYPTKNLGAAGDAGAVVTRDETLAGVVRSLRVHGAGADPTEFRLRGDNGRIDELQAAFLNAKLDRLAQWTERRRRIAQRYRCALARAEASGKLVLPAAAEGHVYHQFTVRVTRGRDDLAAALRADGIETRVFYPRPLHLQPALSEFGRGSGSLPVAERAAREVLSLPIYPNLLDSEQDFVCERLLARLGLP